MKRAFVNGFAAGTVLAILAAAVSPLIGGGAGAAYTDFANVFTANQRVNASVGINVAPGATGTLSLSDALFERSRSTAIGEWIDVAYSAGNFTVPAACVPAACSWTVSSGMQTTYRYMLLGKTLHLVVRLDGTTIVGAPASIRVAVPGGFTINKTIDSIYLAQVTATYQVGAWEAGATRTAVWFYTSPGFAAWSAGTTNNSILYSAAFEVQ